jgi:hypothetical protein
MNKPFKTVDNLGTCPDCGSLILVQVTVQLLGEPDTNPHYATWCKCGNGIASTPDESATKYHNLMRRN